MWYAIVDETNEVIASGKTYRETSDAAYIAYPWGEGPEGGVAPYYLTTIKPKECHVCIIDNMERCQ